MNVIERIKKGELDITDCSVIEDMGKMTPNRLISLKQEKEELMRLAHLGDALLSQRDELEHLAKEHGFYCLQGLLQLISEDDNNG